MKRMMLIGLLIMLMFLISGCCKCCKECELPTSYIEPCPDGFVNWRGDCVPQTVIVNTTECPLGYAITSIGDSVTCTAGLGVTIEVTIEVQEGDPHYIMVGDTFR